MWTTTHLKLLDADAVGQLLHRCRAYLGLNLLYSYLTDNDRVYKELLPTLLPCMRAPNVGKASSTFTN